MAVKRFESITLDRSKAIRLDNGMLRVPARLTRVGVFLYQKPDGSIQRALRLPEEVFKPESMATFDMAPLTNDHPNGGVVDAKNYKSLTVGTLSAPKRDGDFLEANLMISDESAIKEVESGKVELSCGYFCDHDETPGVWQGQPYDYVQRNIRGNHVAIVKHGRAGPQARIQLDAADAVMVQEVEGSFSKTGASPQPIRNVMEKVTIDGLDHEVSPLVKQALSKERQINNAIIEAGKADLAKAKNEIETLKATVDAANAKVSKLEAEAKELPAKIKAEMAERVALEAKAKSVMGAEFKADGLDAVAIKRAVVSKLTSLKCDDKSVAYVDAAFEIALTEHEKKNPATEEAEKELREAPKAKVKTDAAPVANPKDAKSRMLSTFFTPSK